MTAPTIAVYPSDLGGCGFYRIIFPATAVIDAGGTNVDLVMPDRPEEDQLTAQWEELPGGRRRLVDVIAPADVVVIQRPLWGHRVEAIRMLQRKGCKVVVEIDDDFANISRRNVSYSRVDPRTSPERNWRFLAEACELADLVTVSTPRLAQVYGRHGRVAVLPNYVPSRYLGLFPEPRDEVFVGWSGSLETHPDDLQVTRGAIGRAIRATGATFAVIGVGTGVRRALDLPQTPVSSGWRAIDDYPVALSQLDVGIVPLELTSFNEAKSWLKGLEMAALGVPFAASPTGEYRRLAEMGAGVLAENPRQWEGIVKRLIRDPAWRQAQAMRGRVVASRLTIEQHAGRWLEAWESVVNTRASSSVA